MSGNEDEITKNVMHILREARKAKGFTQAQVARELGMSPVASAYQGIEAGSVPLTMDRFFRLCHIFELQPLHVLLKAGLSRAIADMNVSVSEMTRAMNQVHDASMRMSQAWPEFTDLVMLYAEQGEEQS